MSDVFDDLLVLLYWVQVCCECGYYVFFLFDMVQVEVSYFKLQFMYVFYVLLFEGKCEEVLFEIVFLLFFFFGLDEQCVFVFVCWVLQLGFVVFCLSWYESMFGLYDFVVYLCNFYYVGLSDGQVMMMCWYDMCILLIWMQVLIKD